MNPVSSFKRLLKKTPFLKPVFDERNQLIEKNKLLQNELKKWKKGFVPPGHFYSPIPDFDSIAQDRATLSDPKYSINSCISLNEQTQKEMLDIFSQYYSELPFGEAAENGNRYYLDNEYYAYSDGICLYSMMRHLKPKRFIEVGSGFSSCAALDTAELFLSKMPEFTFIEPYPERLNNLLKPIDHHNPKIKIEVSLVQNVPLSMFESLEENDILFIDSSHISKIGSDVNFLFFNVFPILNKGVYIHIHDIFYPFEYPYAWINNQRAWNEIYLLRSFLQWNEKFQIAYFNSYMENNFSKEVHSKLPLCMTPPTNAMTIPGSIWLKKV
ncbi:class I SAM-dependent methyltransferase [Methylomonas koyamae]|uniref:class I SAM-dependent methyltransferase n=1 Tax=Methylomonas koyamae TaxID=702114 RepID=UPI0028733821|nr:class I SAM-dependent methyltransferase [Methylomonas koyamae]WNB78115.1 hypothetical protein RI210_11135 [Methylomonas koyamae]